MSRNAKAENAAIEIMTAIRRYSEQPPPSSDEDQTMTDSIELALGAFYDELDGKMVSVGRRTDDLTA